MIKQPWNRMVQNQSVAPSKSSKTIRTKFVVQNEQQSKPQPIYFKQDPMKQQITIRAKRQNSKINHRQRRQDHLQKVTKLFQDIQKRNEQAKKRLENLKDQVQKQHQKVYTFTPEKRKISKYVVSGDIVRRNEIWLQQKNKKQLCLKEQRTLQQLKQCTFSPELQARKQSQVLLRNRDTTPKKSISRFDMQQNIGMMSARKGKDITAYEYETAKRMLVSRIMNSQG